MACHKLSDGEILALGQLFHDTTSIRGFWDLLQVKVWISGLLRLFFMCREQELHELCKALLLCLGQIFMYSKY